MGKHISLREYLHNFMKARENEKEEKVKPSDRNFSNNRLEIKQSKINNEIEKDDKV